MNDILPDRKYKLKRDDLIYPDLSFLINGVLMDVAKTLGGGHKETYYDKAIATGFKKSGIGFRQQVYVSLVYKDVPVGKYFIDFLVEGVIALEVKRGQFISASVIQQTKQYLSALNLKLGIVACFTYSGVVIKRVVNLY